MCTCVALACEDASETVHVLLTLCLTERTQWGPGLRSLTRK